MLDGQVNVGDGFEAVIAALAELLSSTGSVVDEVTAAVLLIDAPFATAHESDALNVMTAEVPAPSELNDTVRLFPEPPQTPPAVDEQETNDT